MSSMWQQWQWAHYLVVPLQSWEKVFVRGLEKFVPAVAYHFWLNLPDTFSQPRTRTFSQLCTSRSKSAYGFKGHVCLEKRLCPPICKFSLCLYRAVKVQQILFSNQICHFVYIYHPVCKTIAELSCRYNGFGPWQAERGSSTQATQRVTAKTKSQREKRE